MSGCSALRCTALLCDRARARRAGEEEAVFDPAAVEAARAVSMELLRLSMPRAPAAPAGRSRATTPASRGRSRAVTPEPAPQVRSG